MIKSRLAVSTLILLLTAACSQTGSSGPTAPASASGTNDTSAIQLEDFAGRTLTLERHPQHIVALGNGEMDIVYALGGELAGRPTSDLPEWAPEAAADVMQIGSIHDIDLEKIALLHADVVLGNEPLNEKDIASVEGIGAKMVLTSANSVDDIERQITLFGELLGKEDTAAELISGIEQKLDSLKPEGSKPKVLLVYGAPGTYMAALPNSLSGNIVELAGGTNIAADYPSLQNYPQYAQISAERIVEAKPDYVLIMTHGSPESVKEGFLKEMQKNPAWSELDAVKEGRIEVLPSDLFGTSPGTHIGDALDHMFALLHPEG